MDKSRMWILGGDLNMVENIVDRKGGSGRVVAGRERIMEKTCP